ncbi:alpha/beta hydrolase [Pseudarthrobacter sulfonivorans]|uniref:alpha/beta hydrolase n=1 Tax=Pseudarthrobacter sulfonivorans TaxID=121292 RepID=UPI0028641D75|nr:pimeloyl-ACP methyl ester carboxylesterase [Pseudarthrobacter sulfonivorans]
MEELTLRSSTIGRPVATSVQSLNGRIAFGSTPRVVLLVHGFNVSEESARKEFSHHEANIASVLGPLSGSSRFGAVCALHWPGDHPNGGLISAASFPARISDAQLCGERLAHFLSTLRHDQEVILIAHSLGGQVVLNALWWIHEMTRQGRFVGANVTHAFLLAPAVHVSMCAPGQLWGERLCEEHVFYSSRDLVLKLLFGPGSNTYTPVDSPAVGQKGEPLDDRWSCRHPTRLGHGGYWRSREVATEIVKAVVGYAPVRFLPELGNSDQGSLVDERSRASRDLNSRRLPTRDLPRQLR